MAVEDSMVKNEQSYADLTCGTENVSPYSSTSGYSDQGSYYQTDYDWHHQQQQQQQQHQQYHHHEHQQQQQQHQQPHALQATQLTELTSRQYYSYPETHDLTPVSSGYPAFSHPSLHQGDFYSPLQLWPNSQPEYIPPNSLPTPSRLFSGIDVSQHVVLGGQQQPGGLGQNIQNSKPKRKRVQSFSQRKAANVRERRRMFHLNEAFDVLRKRLPAFNYEKRLSRIETLRLAMTYISFMKDVSVGEDPKSIKLKPHGLDLDSPGGLSALLGQSPPLGSGHDLDDEYSDCSNDGMSSVQNGLH